MWPTPSVRWGGRGLVDVPCAPSDSPAFIEAVGGGPRAVLERPWWGPYCGLPFHRAALVASISRGFGGCVGAGAPLPRVPSPDRSVTVARPDVTTSGPPQASPSPEGDMVGGRDSASLEDVLPG